MKLELGSFSVEDALSFIHSWLIENKVHSGYRDRRSAFTMPLPGVMMWVARKYALEQGHNPSEFTEKFEPDFYPHAAPFYEAAWELCRRGLLRPVNSLSHHDNCGDREFNYYALTVYGWEWLAKNTSDFPSPIAYGRFADLLDAHSSRFGGGYKSRSLEALNCYRDTHFLACCVMCGAASESILLSLSIAKYGEEATHKMYRGASGRSRVINKILSNQNAVVQEFLPKLEDLLQYWRSEAAHGLPTPIDEAEAYTSLLTLLRLAGFVEERWAEITAKP